MAVAYFNRFILVPPLTAQPLQLLDVVLELLVKVRVILPASLYAGITMEIETGLSIGVRLPKNDSLCQMRDERFLTMVTGSPIIFRLACGPYVYQGPEPLAESSDE